MGGGGVGSGWGGWSRAWGVSFEERGRPWSLPARARRALVGARCAGEVAEMSRRGAWGEARREDERLGGMVARLIGHEALWHR